MVIRKFTIILWACIFLGGCSIPYIMGLTTKARYAAVNRERLARISEGMSREEVRGIMGTRRFYVEGSMLGLPVDCIHNPEKVESIYLSNGDILEVVYYFTFKIDDGYISAKEMTNLVFKGNILIGWGKYFLEEFLQKSEIKMRTSQRAYELDRESFWYSYD